MVSLIGSPPLLFWITDDNPAHARISCRLTGDGGSKRCEDEDVLQGNPKGI
jgi:hypothetical protein